MDYMEPQDLVHFLAGRGNPFLSFVYWNNEPLSVDEALRRARGLVADTHIARWRDYIYPPPAACSCRQLDSSFAGS
jgi:hypothetical protein